MYVIVNVYYFQPRTIGNEALLRFQQYTQPGTGDVFQLGEIECARPLDRNQKFLSLGTLGGIQPAAAKDLAIFPKFDIKHRVNLTPW